MELKMERKIKYIISDPEVLKKKLITQLKKDAEIYMHRTDDFNDERDLRRLAMLCFNVEENDLRLIIEEGLKKYKTLKKAQMKSLEKAGGFYSKTETAIPVDEIIKTCTQALEKIFGVSECTNKKAIHSLQSGMCCKERISKKKTEPIKKVIKS